MRAEPLENAVWDKICEAIRNPRLIASQIENLKKRASQGKAGMRAQLEEIDRIIAGLDDEENRVLDLYREKVISMEKVRQQIAKVQEKRNRLGQEKDSILAAVAKNPSPELEWGDVVRFCEQVGSRLEGLSGDFDGKRRVLDLLVSRIVLEGRTVRIRGVIPAVPVNTGADPCRIASTTC